MLSPKHMTSLFFIGILVMPGFAPVLTDTFEISNTVVSPLVVQFGDFVEEMAAIAELRSNFPRARVVDFSAYDRIVSFKRPIIYVGHSSDQGIQYNGMTVTWDGLADMIHHSKSNSHCILGCESLKIIELTKSTGKNVFSFGQKIDALIGAMVISGRIVAQSRPSHTIFQKIIQKLVVRFQDLQYSNVIPLFLYPTESEYQLAVKRETLSSQYCVSHWWGKTCVTT